MFYLHKSLLESRLPTIVETISRFVYDDILNEERAYFEKVIEDIFRHNLSKLLDVAYEDGYKKGIEVGAQEAKRFSDISNIVSTISEATGAKINKGAN